MKDVDATDIRRRFVDLAEEVRAGERLIVNRNGRPLVAIVSVEDAARLERGALAGRVARPVDLAAIEGLIKDTAALPTLDARSAEEIIGYDRDGLPSPQW
jgi:prevent-host-death family protein